MNSNTKSEEQQKIESLVTNGLGYTRIPHKRRDIGITFNSKKSQTKLDELNLEAHLGDLELNTAQDPGLELQRYVKDAKNNFLGMYNKLVRNGERISENTMKNESFAEARYYHD